MSSFSANGLTNKGIALQAKAQAGAQLKYTKFVLGDGKLAGQSITTLNNVISPKKTTDVVRLSMVPPNLAKVGFVLSNQDVTTGFFFREIGLFANDPDHGEILYWYANAGDTADYIPPAGGSDVIAKNFDVLPFIGQAQNVSATINQSLVYATHEDVEEAEQRAKSYTDEKVQDLGSTITPGQIGAASKTEFDTHVNDTGLHVTAAKQAAWDAKETTAGSQAKADAAKTAAITAAAIDATNKANAAQAAAIASANGTLNNLVRVNTKGQLEYLSGGTWKSVSSGVVMKASDTVQETGVPSQNFNNTSATLWHVFYPKYTGSCRIKCDILRTTSGDAVVALYAPPDSANKVYGDRNNILRVPIGSYVSNTALGLKEIGFRRYSNNDPLNTTYSVDIFVDFPHPILIVIFVGSGLATATFTNLKICYDV